MRAVAWLVYRQLARRFEAPALTVSAHTTYMGSVLTMHTVYTLAGLLSGFWPTVEADLN